MNFGIQASALLPNYGQTRFSDDPMKVFPVSGPPGLDMPLAAPYKGDQPVYAGHRGYGGWGSASTSASGSATSSFRSSLGDDGEMDDSLTSVHTGVVMRSIPNNFTRETFVRLLDAQGFSGCYDFVYLPIDLQTGAACGYAFVNLHAYEDAERLRIHFNAFADWPMVSEKVCQAAWSNLDGLQGHVDRYRNSSVQHASVPDEFKPALFNKNGERVPFPSPTKKISPPRFKTLVPSLAHGSA